MGEVVEEGGAGTELGASRWEAVEGNYTVESRNERQSLTPPDVGVTDPATLGRTWRLLIRVI